MVPCQPGLFSMKETPLPLTVSQQMNFGLPGLCGRRRGDGVDIVPVHGDSVKAEGGKLRADVAEGHDVVVPAVYLQAVMVENNGEVIELIMGGGHCGLPYLTLLALAVADHGVHLIALAAVLCGHSHAYGDGYTLTERAGAGIDAGSFILVRMPLQVTSELTQSHKLLLREEALVCQHRVKRGAAMPLAQNETVSIRHLRMGGVYVHYVIIQRDQLVNARQGTARMTGLRLVQLFDNINSELSRFLLKRHSLFLHSGL